MSPPPPPPPIQIPAEKRKAPVTIRGLLIILVSVALVFFGVRWVVPAMGAFTGYEAPVQGASPSLLVLGTDLLPPKARENMLSSLLSGSGNSSPQVVVHHRGLALDVHAGEAKSVLPAVTKRLLEDPNRWTHLVIQGQSQLLGVQPYMTSRTEELKNAALLAEQATRATPYLYMTWGYLHGDPRNGVLWPDFGTMQNSLRAGALEAANLLSSSGKEFYVAPVGMGFELVHLDGLVFNKRSPVRLADLYRGSKYPSAAATFLSAAIVVTSLSGERLKHSSAASFGLPLEQENYLRDVANRVVIEGELGQLNFPWRKSTDKLSALEQACRQAYADSHPSLAPIVGCSANATIVTRPRSTDLWALVDVPTQQGAGAWSGLFRTTSTKPLTWQFAASLPLLPVGDSGQMYVRSERDKRYDCADDEVEIGSFKRTHRAFDPQTRQLGWTVQLFDIRCKRAEQACNVSPAIWQLTGSCHVDSPLDDWLCGRIPRATTEHLESWSKVRQQLVGCMPLSPADLN